jgi:hypothetical protein
MITSRRMSLMTRMLTACFVSLWAAAFFSNALATQVEYVSPRQMGEESALVVRGRVGSVRSFWNESHTKILTETVIQVDETYKGGAEGTVRVLQLGGVVDHMRVHVHGALIWHGGEEVLLFLDRMDGGDYRVAGFSQGKLDIERDPVTGNAYIKRPAAEGAEVLGAPPADEQVVVTGPVRMPLDEFVNQALGRK